jgi:hypothetical protein
MPRDPAIAGRYPLTTGPPRADQHAALRASTRLQI